MTAITIACHSAGQHALETVHVDLTTDRLSLALARVLRTLKRSGALWGLERSPGEVRIDLLDPEPGAHSEPPASADKRVRDVAALVRTSIGGAS